MNADRAACTIIAKNYLSFARTLAHSFLAHHADYKFYVLIVDEFAGYVEPVDESFEIIALAELSIPDRERLCFRYDVKELCTAVKADFLSYLINKKSISRLLYLDPDILVTGSLNQLYEQLGTFDIVLTPHLDKDYPADGLLPDDGFILRAGQFNLGFIGVNSSENASAFLNWWKTKLYENCVVDLLSGYFVDQKFIDFVPLFFANFIIERDTGYNVAYWNLHSRKLTKSGDTWLCNSGRLHFFHFSGYVPGGHLISSHIPASLARHVFSNRSDLKELFVEYSQWLLSNGYTESITWPYSYDRFNSGEAITNATRRYYRALEKKGSAPAEPFGSDGLIQREFDNGNDASAEKQLNAILNSRAWSWVCRYGRFKNRISRMFR